MIKINKLPAVMPLPADISEEIKNGKQEETLDVNIQTVAVPKAIMSEPDMWMPQLFNKIEKAFAPKLGYENQNKLAGNHLQRLSFLYLRGRSPCREKKYLVFEA